MPTPCAPPNSARCDLTTELVKEFTELQGVVGGLYARAQGEPEAVWQAIYDHYKPESMEDAIPRTAPAQFVALADKLDTLRGCFGVGPDPHRIARPLRPAARRPGHGPHPRRRPASILPLFDFSAMTKPSGAFFAERVRYYFKDIRGFAYDEINAVHGAARLEQPGRSEARLERVRDLRANRRFRTPRRRFKRIANILQQAKGTGFTARPAGIDEALLEAGPESELYQEFRAHRGSAHRKRDLAPASQSRPLLRQSAGECAGPGASGRIG